MARLTSSTKCKPSISIVRTILIPGVSNSNDSTVTNTTTYGNVTINVVSSVLSYPASFTNSVPYVNSSLTSLESTLTNVSVPFYNSSTGSLSNASVLDVVNSGLRGFTLFAPNNSALAAIQNGLATLESNTSLLQIILDNHVRASRRLLGGISD